MLTFEDCLALSDLTLEEIQAIAEHEHVPDIVAIELGQYIVQSPDGERRIRRIIVDDIEHAKRCGNKERLDLLQQVLQHYLAAHPQARQEVDTP